MSNAQEIINLEQDLENVQYKDDGDWTKHLNKFNELLVQIASYSSPVNETDKTKKLMRTQPPSFAPLAMTAEGNNMSFDRVIANIEGGLSRRAKNKCLSS